MRCDELRHLRALAAVARTGNVSRAAEQIGLTQPRVSQQLMELEEALGCALFGTFLVVPAISIPRSIKLARIDRRASIAFALAPFAFIALAVVGIYATPSPAPPKAERVTRYPDTPETYFWKLTRWRF